MVRIAPSGPEHRACHLRDGSRRMASLARRCEVRAVIAGPLGADGTTNLRQKSNGGLTWLPQFSDLRKYWSG